MIDSVVLTLNSNTFDMIEAPSGQKWNLNSQTDGFRRFIKKFTPAQKADGKTRPRLRYIKQGGGFLVQFEVSLPKMMFGDNVNELSGADFPAVLEVLHERLREQGIYAKPEKLRDAIVSTVHFSKNVVLEDCYHVQSVLSDLAKVNLHDYLNITRDRYPDAGHTLHLAHTKTHEIVFYDKIKDLRKTKARAVDKDQSKKQLSLFRHAESVPEILRIEARYGNRLAVRTAVFGPKNSDVVRFKDVFSESVAMRAVRHEWYAIKQASVSVFTAPVQSQTMLALLLRKKIPKDARDAIYLVGLAMLAKDSDGMRGLRAILGRHFAQETWYRRVLADAPKLTGVFPDHEWVQQIDRAVDNYQSFRVSTAKLGV